MTTQNPGEAPQAAPAPAAPAPAPAQPREGEAAAATDAAPKEEPVQVDKAVFLAARLREALAENANLRTVVATLQQENARYRAQETQAEISRLDSEYDVGQGTVLQARDDGTYWRIPESMVQRQAPPPQG